LVEEVWMFCMPDAKAALSVAASGEAQAPAPALACLLGLPATSPPLTAIGN
jgi:hypothetical protein